MSRRDCTPGGGRLRPLGTPRTIRVRTDAHQRPVAVMSGNRWTRTEAVRERWRIDDEWWRHPVSREYYVLVLEAGRVMTIYQDLTTRTWYLQS